jgi:predicted esterase
MRLKFIFALAVVCGFFSTSQAQQTAKITSSGIGYLEYVPQDYNQNSNDYPIVIFLHGIGERGTTSTDPTTLKSSVQKVANVGLAKYVKYGTQYPFILISPQLKSSYGTWPANYVMDVLNHVKKYLRVNEKRIYITGLSLGGFGTWTTLGAYPEVFAAAVPICSGGNALSKACAIAAENVPLWAFHGTADNIVSYTVTTKMIDAVNACTPKPDPLAKTTLFSGLGHIIWDKVYKETNAVNWMISFTNGTTSGGTTNNPPVVDAGTDKSVTLPTNEVYMQGAASDGDGSIASYSWTKVSGGAASLSGTTGSKLRAYNLIEGSYSFRLTVKDDKGASKYDDVKVTVAGQTSANVAPVANAGPDKTTSSTSITLSGSGTDKDGKIVSYRWTKYYGGTVTLTNATSAAVTVSGMKDGKYFLRLTVTDDDGATDYDNMQVVVSGTSTSGGTTANIAPVANAGSDRTTSSTSITLNGSGTDKDGTIASYKWTQYGGAATTMTNSNTANVAISGLKSGKYYFRLTVTDNDGATDYDNMLVAVGSTSTAFNIAPVSNAGPDKRITDALSSIKLFGSGYDKDGRIVSYKWTQYGGPDLTLNNTTSSTVTVADLEAGKYYLKLTVKDDDGAVDQDNILIIVNES